MAAAAAICGKQISKELTSGADAVELEDIRVIKDRNTKKSRGFGFLRFANISKARAFLEQSYPMLRVTYQEANGDRQVAKIRVAYSREREDRSRGDGDLDRTCRFCKFINFPGRKTCLKCHSPLGQWSPISGTSLTFQDLPFGTQPQEEFVNSGDSDVSPDNTPSQFLLFRSLEPTVTDELLAKGVAKLYKHAKPSQDTSSKPKKGHPKITSTTGDASLGAKEGSLRRVMIVKDRETGESWRYGFAEFAAVQDAQAALTKYNSFERFTIASKPVQVSFIHSGVFVPVFDPSTGPDEVSFASSLNPAMRLQYWDEGAYVSELIVNAGEAPQGEGVQQHGSSADAAAMAAEREGLVAAEDEGSAKNKKRKTEAAGSDKAKKAAPAHLQFWSNRHAELHGLPKKQDDESAPEVPDATANEQAPEAIQAAQSYANPTKLCCYLCSRQFKTDAEVKKHEKLSQLHQINLQNPTLKEKALAKLVKAGIDPDAARITQAPEYRDRAKERRQAFGSSKRLAHLPMKADHKPEAAEEPPAVPSKGAALLGKMGWSEGQGLGVSGSGIAAPIDTDVYAAGVGLGAEGGKIGNAAEEAQRNTKDSYADFVQRAKDKAKERFEHLSRDTPSSGV